MWKTRPEEKERLGFPVPHCRPFEFADPEQGFPRDC